MTDRAGVLGVEPGPSAWSHRLPLLALTVSGLVVAGYLTAFQLGFVSTVWEPLFGDGSARILTSGLARSLPVPDASLGMLAYLVEGLLALAGGSDRWWRHPRIVLLMGLLVAGMALGSIGLILVQAVDFRTGCSLCLASAAISLMLAVLVAPEVLAALRRVRSLRAEAAPMPETSSRGLHSRTPAVHPVDQPRHSR